MSQLKVNTVRHTAGSADNITLDNSQNVTCENNLQVDGNVTVTGTLPADKLTGNLPAISGASLTGIPTRTQPFRNLIINGAFQVAQRGTTSTSTVYKTVDRWMGLWGGTDEDCTQAQVTLTSSDTGPWAKGFRNAFQITNGNQTSGAGSNDYVELSTRIEAQDVANSGWDYSSASSKLALSFWVKSSVAQNFYGRLQSIDGTGQNYPFETGSLSANTWTKITKIIPGGEANLQFDNNNAAGLDLFIIPFQGTDRTATPTLNAWAAYSSSSKSPDMTSTWYTTNDSTFAITGVQLEVGDAATEFEHRSYGDELQRCYRYFYMHADGSQGQWASIGMLAAKTAGAFRCMIPYPTRMRTTPGLYKVVGTDYFRMYTGNDYQDSDDIAFDTNSGNMMGLLEITDDIATTQYRAGYAQIANQSAARLGFDAEL